MFDNQKKNILMLEGAYRKFKNYYYYNKNFIVMRNKIAEFEIDPIAMDNTFLLLSKYLENPKSKVNQSYMNQLMSKIDFTLVPKKFEDDNVFPYERPVSNLVSKNKKLKSVNFFIDMPIELHLIDTLWAQLVSKVAYDEELITDNLYGNIIRDSIAKANSIDEMDFESNRLFKMYFNQYTHWRNNAFDQLKENYQKKIDSLLISIDIKSYFYSVKFSFEELLKLNHVLMSQISVLTNVIEHIYEIHERNMSHHRVDILYHEDKRYPLPIGLFSSLVIANLYLSDFDKKAANNPTIAYYGRYVDDILIVYKKSVKNSDSISEVIESTLIRDRLLKRVENDFVVEGFNELKIQSSKVKTIIINHKESRSILDQYDKTIRIVPSQMDPFPDYTMKISSFSENAYSLGSFSKETKIREIEHLSIDAFRVGRFFSSLVHKFAQIQSFDSKQTDKQKVSMIKKEVSDNIVQINHFFLGNQAIEYYMNWMNYMCFLVETQRPNDLKSFYYETKFKINQLQVNALDRNEYVNSNTLANKINEFLHMNLEVCLHSALCLDLKMAEKHFKGKVRNVEKYLNANMFNHSVVALPFANYLYYDKKVSYQKMEIHEIGEYLPFDHNLKLKWNPRYISYYEISLAFFYQKHKFRDKYDDDKFSEANAKKEFLKINFLKEIPEVSAIIKKRTDEYKINNKEETDYIFKTTSINSSHCVDDLNANIGIANIKLDYNHVKKTHRWGSIPLEYKISINNILKDMYNKSDKSIKILVFPELSIPIYWLKDLILFSKKTQVAIVAGLQYLMDEDRAFNYSITILPYLTGKKKFQNVLFSIREKNDYSPVERIELATMGMKCVDSKTAEYEIFRWNNINLSTYICYELTDVVARSLLKGRCDLLVVPVFNRDTSYFSSIIESTTRDLHTYIAQANTSIYGDSRLIGPFEKNSRDIIKIKGGENESLSLGIVDFNTLYEFQRNYKNQLESSINNTLSKGVPKSKINNSSLQKSPSIKPFSARFSNQRSKIK